MVGVINVSVKFTANSIALFIQFTAITYNNKPTVFLFTPYYLKGLAKTAFAPNSASISSNRLYLAILSLRQAEPVLI